MLLTAAASGSSRLLLLLPLRTEGGAGAPPRICAAKLGALTTLPLRSTSSTFSCACSPSPGDKDSARVLFDDYSVLSPDIPWEVEDIWRTFAAYFFILHIPLSFGGLGVVAKVLHCPSLGPLTTIASTVMLQLVELTLALALLQYIAKPHHEVQTFFAGKLPLQRSWVKETVLGFGFLMTVVSLTSFIADKLIGSEDAFDPILKEILSDSPTSSLVCFFLYCVIAPLSEETIYRGFLLTALSSSMKWWDAVMQYPKHFHDRPPENLDDMDRMFDKAYIMGNTSAIPGEPTQEDQIVVDIDCSEDDEEDATVDAENNEVVCMKPKVVAKRRANNINPSPKKNKKNPIARDFKRMMDIMAKCPVQSGPSIADVIDIAI